MGRRPAAMAAMAVVAIGAALAGCSSPSTGTPGASYISGDGSLLLLPPGKRAAPVQFAGTTLEGDRFDLAGQRGKVVVVNVWGSWCPPCRKEARDLQAAWQQLQGKGVQFVGIDTGSEEQPAQALAYQKTFGITYPSVADDGGSVLLPLRGAVSPKAIPSTLVIDPQSRVAARISGATTTATLVGLVEDVIAGRTRPAGGSGGATG
jgi:thiol-disulfide isomerase/thioredoxin